MGRWINLVISCLGFLAMLLSSIASLAMACYVLFTKWDDIVIMLFSSTMFFSSLLFGGLAWLSVEQIMDDIYELRR